MVFIDRVQLLLLNRMVEDVFYVSDLRLVYYIKNESQVYRLI